MGSASDPPCEERTYRPILARSKEVRRKAHPFDQAVGRFVGGAHGFADGMA